MARTGLRSTPARYPVSEEPAGKVPTNVSPGKALGQLLPAGVLLPAFVAIQTLLYFSETMPD